MRDKPLSTVQAAAIAHKHPRTIVAWIHRGLLPAMKMPGGRGPYIIYREDLDRAIAELTTPKPYTPRTFDESQDKPQG